MFRMIAGVFVALVAALLIFAATRPDTFHVERSARVKAPPEEIFALVADFKAWDAWSPWEKKDPAMKRTFGGAKRGAGAVYAWEGNSDVGAGRMEITTAVPASRIALNLDFIKPFEAHNVVEFTFAPDGDATHVTWAMHGPMPYVSKLMSVFVSMDRLIGKDFETGLAKLKAAAEKQGESPRRNPR